jgi:Family of unknown function (DUF6526)
MAQNAKNHARYVPVWHFVTPVIMLALLGGSINNFIHSDEHTHYSAALILGINLLLIIFYWYTRAFALRAQDRAIRAEENFRHFVLTGKPLDRKLRMGQIIALRFASDAEFAALAERAVKENLSSKDIKEAVQNWRADYNRV